MPAGLERGVQTVRCERQREQPGTELPSRDACELATTAMRDGMCMKANLQLRPTFDLSGMPKACPLEGIRRDFPNPMTVSMHQD